MTIGADHFDCLFVYDGHRTERGTYNFYVNETFQGRATGRIAAVSFDSEEISEDILRVVQRLEWQGPVEWGAAERRVLATEIRTIEVSTTGRANVLDIRSRLEPTEWDIVIGPTRHAYFTVRMADGLRVVDGGRSVDADGRGAVEAINDNTAAWVDMSAVGPHGQEVGVTVVSHSCPNPAAWYAHEWGSVAFNPFLHEERSIQRGKALELRVTVVAHDGPLSHDLIESVYDVRDR